MNTRNYVFFSLVFSLLLWKTYVLLSAFNLSFISRTTYMSLNFRFDENSWRSAILFFSVLCFVPHSVWIFKWFLRLSLNSITKTATAVKTSDSNAVRERERREREKKCVLQNQCRHWFSWSSPMDDFFPKSEKISKIPLYNHFGLPSYRIDPFALHIERHWLK